MNELELTPTQTIIFFVVMLLLLAYQLYKLSKDTITIELPEQQDQKPAYNPNYGAYIQLAGKRYN
ncbi:hypothetical protein [Streptococcus gordonii]|uniref:Phage protein n=1 Tax=Streptococcus gordonii TaxID=1302 RepID=A0AB35FUY4_STRGN|nr:hypothetical protein [Streptococcus gordonii]QBX08301.1 hypothetical protein JavanS243_0013 [Streptococcus satellite phage Javan243]MBZ2128025.1 hypothetical protein [Streptococcus gordonii]MBZ2129719.1 hypothetical protein [Streptococcus gordonii]MBZ2147310.1 hypothetical protein [Streptococcus gordonii]RSJ41983.1 hypothetical protein D8819_06685 [Streptococcus gordonii]